MAFADDTTAVEKTVELLQTTTDTLVEVLGAAGLCVATEKSVHLAFMFSGRAQEKGQIILAEEMEARRILRVRCQGQLVPIVDADCGNKISGNSY